LLRATDRDDPVSSQVSLFDRVAQDHRFFILKHHGNFYCELYASLETLFYNDERGMPGRNINVPIETARSVVTIADCGSFTKAGEVLGQSQPAISAQVKRIQQIIGGPIFTKRSAGTVPTSLGLLVIAQARRMLEANDQLVQLGGGPRAQQTRLGISPFVTQLLFDRLPKQQIAKLTISCENSPEIAALLVEGVIDIAWIYDVPDRSQLDADLIIVSHASEFMWVRAKDFVLSPGSPLPLLSSPGLITDDVMLRTLSKQGMMYRLAFNSPYLDSKFIAARAGLGVTIVPRGMVPSGLVEAKDYYLPKLPPIRSLLCARPELSPQSREILELLKHEIFDEVRFKTIYER
jgi:DNA-binding transcriptional LysR family regulator